MKVGADVAVVVVFGAGGGCACPFGAGCAAGVAFVVPVGWKSGLKRGRSGRNVVALVSSATSMPCGKLAKYFCRYEGYQYDPNRIVLVVKEHTCSIGASLAAMKFATSASDSGTTLSFSHSLQYHSLSTSSITLWSIGGWWQKRWYGVLHPSQKTIMLLAGLVPRKHTLHTADSGFFRYVRFRLFVDDVGDGCGGGTNAVGFCTDRPDFVIVATGVITSLLSESPSSSSSSPSSRFRLPPLPPPRPLPLPLPRPLPRPVEPGVADDASSPSALPLAVDAVRLPPLPPRLDTLASPLGSGVEILSDVAISFMICSLAASHPGVPALAAVAAFALILLITSSVWAENCGGSYGDDCFPDVSWGAVSEAGSVRSVVGGSDKLEDGGA